MSNQGPLLGIFFTAPLGAVFGILLGLIVPSITSKISRLMTVLVLATLLYGGGIWIALAFTPDPGGSSAVKE